MGMHTLPSQTPLFLSDSYVYCAVSLAVVEGQAVTSFGACGSSGVCAFLIAHVGYSLCHGECTKEGQIIHQFS